MPVMDGIDATRLIMSRQQQQLQEDHLSTTPNKKFAKVIFVTAHALDNFKNECMEAGGSDFLSKPYRIQDVEQCLQRLEHKMLMEQYQ